MQGHLCLNLFPLFKTRFAAQWLRHYNWRNLGAVSPKLGGWIKWIWNLLTLSWLLEATYRTASYFPNPSYRQKRPLPFLVTCSIRSPDQAMATRILSATTSLRRMLRMWRMTRKQKSFWQREETNFLSPQPRLACRKRIFRVAEGDYHLPCPCHLKILRWAHESIVQNWDLDV